MFAGEITKFNNDGGETEKLLTTWSDFIPQIIHHDGKFSIRCLTSRWWVWQICK